MLFICFTVGSVKKHYGIYLFTVVSVRKYYAIYLFYCSEYKEILCYLFVLL